MRTPLEPPPAGPQPLSAAALRRVFREARRDPDLAVLEGLHALKHALRFGAQIERVVLTDPERVRALAQTMAPDVLGVLAQRLQTATSVPRGALAQSIETAPPDPLDTPPQHTRTAAPDPLDPVPPPTQTVVPEVFATLAPQPPATGVIALARRPPYDASSVLQDARAAPLVLLEDPRDLGNLGACVRVAAAADIAGVLTTGTHDPWDPAALRGSAGLHFALPVAHLDEHHLDELGGQSTARAVPAATADREPREHGRHKPNAGGRRAQRDHGRPLIAVDPDGEPFSPTAMPPRAILAFGGERRGLSPALLARADARVRLPMRAGVSSLNLATSVAALLYSWRLAS
jgi:TrmH family RNA methyltransferase